MAGITARGEPVEILEVDELAPPAADEVLLDEPVRPTWRYRRKLGEEIVSSDLPPQLFLRVAVALTGVGLLAAGATAVFVTDNGTGSAALVAIGAALLLAAGLWGPSRELRVRRGKNANANRRAAARPCG